MGMAERIKEKRIELGLTQEELGEKLGLQKSAIAKYENGRVENIKRSVIADMAKIFNCSPTYLMDFDEPTEVASSNKANAEHPNVIDNNKGSRWQAATNGPDEYVIIDLGEEYNIGRILILWENANASDYDIEYSLDGENWDSLLNYKDPNPGLHSRVDSHIFAAVDARYIKITMNVAGSMYGYSIFEIDIFQSLVG